MALQNREFGPAPTPSACPAQPRTGQNGAGQNGRVGAWPAAVSHSGDRGARFRPRVRPFRRATVSAVALALGMLTAVPIVPAAAQGAGGTELGDPFGNARQRMVDQQVRRRGIREPSVLSAMEQIPRHLFVPEVMKPRAYDDVPVQIAPGQTLSQAYVSARMISLLQLDGDERVLEIGTGSGYDAAILSKLAREVWTIEIDPDLGSGAIERLERLGYDNVQVRIDNGYHGWPEKAPFDAILVTAAPTEIPEPLFRQLAVGGKMVVAVGYSLHQDLKVITRTGPGPRDRRERRISMVNLTPMTGGDEEPSRRLDRRD